MAQLITNLLQSDQYMIFINHQMSHTKLSYAYSQDTVAGEQIFSVNERDISQKLPLLCLANDLDKHKVKMNNVQVSPTGIHPIDILCENEIRQCIKITMPNHREQNLFLQKSNQEKKNLC